MEEENKHIDIEYLRELQSLIIQYQAVFADCTLILINRYKEKTSNG